MSLKKKFVILGFVFLVLLGILPFLINLLYLLGGIKPLIILPYSQAEILNYVTASLGVLIAFFAVGISILQGQPKIEIKREQAVEYDVNGHRSNKIIEQISVRNRSSMEIEIKSIGLMSCAKVKKEMTS